MAKIIKLNSNDLNEMFKSKSLQWSDGNACLFLDGYGYATAPEKFWDYAQAGSDEPSDIIVADGFSYEFHFKF